MQVFYTEDGGCLECAAGADGEGRYNGGVSEADKSAGETQRVRQHLWSEAAAP